MLEQYQIDYLVSILDAITQQKDVRFQEATDETFFMVVEGDKEPLYLEIRKDNRFGKNLDS